MKFSDLNLIAPIERAIQEVGYETPTPIQEQAIPILLKGHDLLGCAQTGTGKTASFAIPILQLLYLAKQHESKRRPLTTLILTPTRELAIQIGESFTDYGKYTGLKHTVIFGGVNQHSQVEALRDTVNIIIATPGRLLDLMQQGHIHLNFIKWFVLDEADRMLDMGFVHDVKKVVKQLPQERQNLFFSATMPQAIVELSQSILRNPQKVEVTPVSSTAEKVEQELYYVDKGNKRKLLWHILQNTPFKSVLVFTRTKHGADRVAREITKQGIKTAAIHGDKTQNARQKALGDFKDGTIKVLIATDIAARGIDIDKLSHVINYDIPEVAETYVHRIGRTGRAGEEGIAISFADIEEKPYIKDIEKLIKQSIPVHTEHPFPMEILRVEDKPKPVKPPRREHNHPTSVEKAKNSRKWMGASKGR